jgi:hypothetical protein
VSSFACTQPLGSTQLSVVHGFVSAQLTGLPPPHTPALQVCAAMQMPVEHAVPFATGVWTQPPPLNASLVHGLVSSQTGV